jgi:DNA-binding transcriptional LysR family regulator
MDIALTNIRAIDLNLLVVFDVLFDERSVTRAARRLAVTQPTMSGSLKRLRQAFSDQLFLRTSRGILPTPRAEALAESIKDLIASVQTLMTPKAFDPMTAEATIRICGGDYVQHAIISPFIRALRSAAPKVQVTVVPRLADDAMTELSARGEMDIAITSREAVAPDLTSRLLLRERYLCVVRRKHPLKAGRISLGQLCAFDHLLVNPSGDRLSQAFDTTLAKQRLRRRIAVTVPTYHLLFDILESDDFIAFVPEGLCQGRAGLKVVKPDLSLPSVDVLASWHPRLNEDAQHKWLRELLVKVSKQLQAG